MRRSLLVVLALTGAARAEGDRALSLDLGYGTFSVPGVAMGNMQPPSISPDWGVDLGGTYEHSLSTDLGLRFELAGSLFDGGAVTGGTAKKKVSNMSYAGLGAAGIVFRFDVLKLVPYAFGGVGGVVSSGGPITNDTDFVVVVGGGVDWLSSRTRSYGIEGRLASFGGDITVFTLNFRGSLRWGYF
jgi:hypothetical protein